MKNIKIVIVAMLLIMAAVSCKTSEEIVQTEIQVFELKDGFYYFEVMTGEGEILRFTQDPVGEDLAKGDTLKRYKKPSEYYYEYFLNGEKLTQIKQ